MIHKGATRLAICVARDISNAGIGLTLKDTRGIPSEFELALEGEPARRCFVRWRNQFSLGVIFLSRHAGRISD